MKPAASAHRCRATTTAIALAAAALVSSLGPMAAQPAERSLNPLSSIRIEDLKLTREQPLFSKDRRSYRPAVAAPGSITAPLPQAPNLSLVGVVIGEGAPIVVLLDHGRKKQVRVREGDIYEGWTVGAVRPRQAVLRRDGTEFRLMLPTTKPEP